MVGVGCGLYWVWCWLWWSIVPGNEASEPPRDSIGEEAKEEGEEQKGSREVEGRGGGTDRAELGGTVMSSGALDRGVVDRGALDRGALDSGALDSD